LELPKTQHVTIDRTAQAVVITPDANLTGDSATEELLAVLGRLETERVPCVVIDLSKVEFINSLALGVILSGHVRLGRAGSKLVLCHVNERIARVILITKLQNELRVRESVERAVAACGG